MLRKCWRTQVALAGAVEQSSTSSSADSHSTPRTQQILTKSIEDVKTVGGRGVEGMIDGKYLRVEHCNWLSLSAQSLVRSLSSSGLTTFRFTVDGTLTVVSRPRNTFRFEIWSTIDQLEQRGVYFHIHA